MSTLRSAAAMASAPRPPPKPPPQIKQLAELLLGGSRAALARAITLVEVGADRMRAARAAQLRGSFICEREQHSSAAHLFDRMRAARAAQPCSLFLHLWFVVIKLLYCHHPWPACCGQRSCRQLMVAVHLRLPAPACARLSLQSTREIDREHSAVLLETVLMAGGDPGQQRTASGAPSAG